MKTFERIRSNKLGFTLIEVMIVTVIVGVVAALAVPGFQNAYDRQTFRSGYQDMLSTLKKARSTAISTKQPHGVYFDPEAMSVTLFSNTSDPATNAYDGGDSVLSVDTLPEVFRYLYADVENSAIVFRSNGSAQLTGYCSISLAGESSRMMAYFSTSVLAATGRISSYSGYYAW